MHSPRPRLPTLVLVTCVGPIATDTYLAALPQVQHSLETTSTVAQLTMTAFIAGMAVGQVLAGPLSDAHGRRRLVIAGALAFTLTSLWCVVAGTGPELVLARGAQGLAAGIGVSVGRAAVSDSYAGPRAAAVFGTLSSLGLIGPVIAPAIGSGLLHLGSWRTVFAFLLVVGVLMSAFAIGGFPETLPPERRQGRGLTHLAQRAGDLLRDRAFVLPVVTQCLVVAGFFVYIGGSSIVLQRQYDLGPDRYSLLFATNALAMVSASIAFRVLVVRTGALPLRRVALGVIFSAATFLLASCLLAPGHQPPLAVVWAGLAFMLAGLGAYLPSNTVIVQAAGIRSAGTAAALGGGLPFLVGALSTPLTGLLDAEAVFPMVGLMCGFYALAAVVALRSRRAPVEVVEPGERAAAGCARGELNPHALSGTRT